jgi:hypothetical protein
MPYSAEAPMSHSQNDNAKLRNIANSQVGAASI